MKRPFRLYKTISIDRESGGVDANVTAIHQHPKYRLIPYVQDGKTLSKAVFDIGILKLSNPIESSDTIQFATLAASGSRPDPPANKTKRGLHEKPEFAPQLLRVDLPVSDIKTCMDKDTAEDTDIICAGGGTIGVMEGDSGSPLIDPKTRQVVGVAARGGALNIVNPQTFTNVGSYIDFITELLEKAPQGGSSPAEETTGNNPTQASPDDDERGRIQRAFALIREIPKLQSAFNEDALLKFQLGSKLQAAEEDLLANLGEADFRLRVEQHFAEFNKIPNVQFAMDKDETLKTQLPLKLSEAKKDLLALGGPAWK
ncbi:Caldecrin precursor (Chymotrypsin C) isoform 3 [Cordyceps militaris CM01]|uniref:Caldecrin (Chymotrypsin C) isoform 3 n=1 Tax=Cordyceps militaris (strain CM01) TaxID=983644 RepID=G3JR24_CORMM|nr:Caldecrin precursor (Chymotrypsin C) isoform 3 [Cordyceps militaris CM01]EGX88320.1 Caldecrin precursor (Chymotrypsin C) isoform 3 [Cordyceps militaris CM01]